MTSDARDRLTKLYHAALTRAPEERSAFLKDACDGDETLRQEVESLLRYASDKAPFLEHTCDAPGPASSWMRPGAGSASRRTSRSRTPANPRRKVSEGIVE